MVQNHSLRSPTAEPGQLWTISQSISQKRPCYFHQNRNTRYQKQRNNNKDEGGVTKSNDAICLKVVAPPEKKYTMNSDSPKPIMLIDNTDS